MRVGVSHGPWREITFGSPYPRVKHSSRKSSATHSYQCVQYFRVSEQFNVRTDVDAWYFTGHPGCTDTVRQSLHWMLTLGVRIPLQHWGLEPASELHMAFQSDTLQTDLSRPLNIKMICIKKKCFLNIGVEIYFILFSYKINRGNGAIAIETELLGFYYLHLISEILKYYYSLSISDFTNKY